MDATPHPEHPQCSGLDANRTVVLTSAVRGPFLPRWHAGPAWPAALASAFGGVSLDGRREEPRFFSVAAEDDFHAKHTRM